MAKWKADCICSECGKHYEREGFEYNRRLADSKAKYVEEHAGLCPECYEKSCIKKAEEVMASKGFALPEIKGKSDRQIKYAFDLRIKSINKYKGLLDKISNVDIEKIKTFYEQSKNDNKYKCHPLLMIASCIVESNAHELIEILG